MLTDYAYLKPKITRRTIMMIINIVGFLFIGLIVWWFWLYTPKDVVNTSAETITIVLENGVYKPARLKAEKGKALTLQFLRKDPSSCADTVIFSDVEISQDLPLNVSTSVTLPSMTAGEYAFHCPMKMYLGVLVVE